MRRRRQRAGLASSVAAPDDRDFVGYGRRPPVVRWPNDARLAVSLQINYEAGAEYTFEEDGRNEGVGEWLTGMDNSVADLATQSIYEYESRAGFWRIMRILDEFGTPATVNACAVAVERNPEVAEYLRASSHEVCCHGWRWEETWTYSREKESELMARAVASLEATTGKRPRGWSSRLMQSSNTRELLVEHGFRYDSDALNDDLPYIVDVVGSDHVVVPLSFTNNDAQFIFGQCDPPGFASLLSMALGELLREGTTHPKMMTIALHPRWIGQAGRAAALRSFLDHASAQDGIWFARREEIADWWFEHHEEFSR